MCGWNLHLLLSHTQERNTPMDQQNLRNMLQTLSADERMALVTIYSLFHDYRSYTEIHDYDLYTSVPDFNDFDHIHEVMAALKAKGLVEVSEDEDGIHSVTKIVCITDLNSEELHVFGTIIGFMRAFEKAIDFRNIAGNVRQGISEEDLPTHLHSLARRSLITMDQNYTVIEVFSGAIFDEQKSQRPPVEAEVALLDTAFTKLEQKEEAYRCHFGPIAPLSERTR